MYVRETVDLACYMKYKARVANPTWMRSLHCHPSEKDCEVIRYVSFIFTGFSVASQLAPAWMQRRFSVEIGNIFAHFCSSHHEGENEEVWTNTIVIAMYCKKVSNFKLVTASTYYLVVTCTILTTFYCTCLLFSANLQFPSMDIWSWCVPSMGGK